MPKYFHLAPVLVWHTINDFVTTQCEQPLTFIFYVACVVTYLTKLKKKNIKK